ncbi:MAG: HAD-IC family P-type ATPase [Chloroflexi bacterium]|nr:HAD-IC family P-type ATPase [Chloroflexota bacterium]
MATVTEIPSQSVLGLTETEAQQRRVQGQGNDIRLATSRTYADIIRYNVLNPINIVLYVIGGVLVVLGRPDDAFVTVGTVLLNVSLGLIQEIRAKRKLDQIALLTRPRVTILRDGQEREVDPSEVVLGDVLLAKPGDQIVVDGTILSDNLIEVDESALTGESDPIEKSCGDEVLSGSFVVSGSAQYEAVRVGHDSFVNKLTAQARQFRVRLTPLQRDLNFVIRLLTLIAGLLGFMLGISSLIFDIPAVRTAQTAAILAGLIPTGLFAMVVVAYGLGALRMVRTGTLVQQTNAIESFSNVNILCTDKTGTLTANRLTYDDVHPVAVDKPTLQTLLADFVSSGSAANKTSDAIRAALGGSAHHRVDEVTFSSARKWSAIACDDETMQGVYVFGALEMLAPQLDSAEDLQAQALELARTGRRVLLFAHAAQTTALRDADGQPALPPQLTPLGLVSLKDELREGVHETIAAFNEAGIEIKIISGDNAETVAALARQAGFPADIAVVSGLDLAAMSPAEFSEAAQRGTIFGRITPEQKERLVDCLRQRGHYVAMIGDGVNDVLSLKKSDVAIAMFSGTAAARAVADVVLLNDSFHTLPRALLEGQRIVNGLRSTMRIFQARSFFVVTMIMSVSIIGVGFPYLPKHNSLLATIAATLPSFLLTLIAPPVKSDEPLLANVYRFAIPAALVSGLFGLIVYLGSFVLIYSNVIELPFDSELVGAYQSYAGIDYAINTQDEFSTELANFFAQTTLTIFTAFVGAILVLFAAPPIQFFADGEGVRGDQRVWGIAGLVLIALIAVLMIDPLREFFELVPLSPLVYFTLGILTALWMMTLRLVWRRGSIFRFLGLNRRLQVAVDL